MDIEILLWFQQIREALDPVFDFIVGYASDIALFSAAVIPFVFYWCSDKEEGKDILLALGISLFLNQFLKVTFSVYRPWIRDPRLIPSVVGRTFATGYSFPSGHTQVGGTIYFSIGTMLKKTRSRTAAVCMIMPVLIGLSRMYLGVHTPQDVLTGLLIAALSVALINRGDRIVDSHPEYRKYLPWIAAAFSIAGIVYALRADYPLDYADGKVIVAPIEMIRDALFCIGVFFGVFAGTALETRHLGFVTDGTRSEKILRFIIGSAGVAAIVLFTRVPFFSRLDNGMLSLAAGVLLGVYSMYLFPLMFTALRKKRMQQNQA